MCSLQVQGKLNRRNPDLITSEFRKALPGTYLLVLVVVVKNDVRHCDHWHLVRYSDYMVVVFS
jgi:hypothetical protein